MAQEPNPIDFTVPWAYADIVFIVEEQQIHASKLILSMWSPVFQAMFSDNFKEKNAKEIDLPGKEVESMLELMAVLHPPNKEITNHNVIQLLPLAQEYQIEKMTDRLEEFLLSQASSVKHYILAQKYGLEKLLEANTQYLKKAPISRLKSQPEFDSLDQAVLQQVLIEKCEKFDGIVEGLREVRMVLERKRPTTFPGMHLLCMNCTDARESQLDCGGCMKNCCKKIVEILRSLER